MKVCAMLASVLIAVLVGFAQAPPALKSVIGEVTSIDGAGKQIKLKADDGAVYTVTLSDSTSFLRIPPGEKDVKKATKIVFRMWRWAIARWLEGRSPRTPRPSPRAL